VIIFNLPTDMERRPMPERLRIYARQLAPREGGLRLIALLEEAADELELAAQAGAPADGLRPPRACDFRRTDRGSS
jgi:hypothetical protein